MPVRIRRGGQLALQQHTAIHPQDLQATAEVVLAGCVWNLLGAYQPGR